MPGDWNEHRIERGNGETLYNSPFVSGPGQNQHVTNQTRFQHVDLNFRECSCSFPRNLVPLSASSGCKTCKWDYSGKARTEGQVQVGWLPSDIVLWRYMLWKPECQTWRRRQDDLRMQQIIWAKEMELRKAEKSQGNEIG